MHHTWQGFGLGIGPTPPGVARDTIDEGRRLPSTVSAPLSISPSSHTVVLGGARRNPWMAQRGGPAADPSPKPNPNQYGHLALPWISHNKTIIQNDTHACEFSEQTPSNALKNATWGADIEHVRSTLPSTQCLNQ